MKSLSWRLGLAAMCAVLTVFGRTTPVYAAEEEHAAPADRLERLERRVNEIAQQQEQMMHHLAAAQERQAQMAGPGGENFPPGMAPPGRAGMGQPTPLQGGPAPAGIPGPAGLRAPVGKHLEDIAGVFRLFLLVALLFNILITTWIYTDIRKRGEGPGIFIALALLAGIPAAIIYAIVRIGDKKP